jgi:hypothetical protein
MSSIQIDRSYGLVLKSQNTLKSNNILYDKLNRRNGMAVSNISPEVCVN